MVLNYIYMTIFISFPEALLILILGFNLSNMKNVDISKLILISIIQSIVVFLIRISNVKLGIHSIIQMASMYVLVIIFLKIKFYKAIIPVLIGSLLQGLIQSFAMPIFIILKGSELSKLYTDPIIAITAFIPASIITLLILHIIKRKNILLCDITK